MLSHPIINGEIPETVLFFDLAANRQNPEIIEVQNLSKLVSLGSLKALTIQPEIFVKRLTDPLLQLQIDQLYKKIADHPDELYYVLMLGVMNIRANNRWEAMEAFEYLTIFNSQQKKFDHNPDNNIVFALTRYFMHLLSTTSYSIADTWKNIRPTTIKICIHLPPLSPYYITEVIFKSGVNRAHMLNIGPCTYVLPADYSLGQILGNNFTTAGNA